MAALDAEMTALEEVIASQKKKLELLGALRRATLAGLTLPAEGDACGPVLAAARDLECGGVPMGGGRGGGGSGRPRGGEEECVRPASSFFLSC